MPSRHSSPGFTLLELLVVISIIGLLSSFLVASLSQARAKARDTRRKAELRSMQTALELYFNDNNGYPVAPGWLSSEPGDGPPAPGDYIPGLVPAYMARLPRDPLGGPSHINPPCGPPWKRAYVYYSPDGLNYSLLAHCSAEGPMSPDDAFYDPNRPTWAWKVCSGELACSNW